MGPPPLLPRRSNNSPEFLSSGDFEVVESPAAVLRGRPMSPTIPPPAQSPLSNPRSLRQPQSFTPQTFAPQQSYAPQSFAPPSYAPPSYAPQSYAPQSYAAPLPISQRPLPGARPVYQQRLHAPVPQNEAELHRFLAQFEPSGLRRVSTPVSVQPAMLRQEPQLRVAPPFARTATPVIPHATASATSSLAPVAISDESGQHEFLTSKTVVIRPARARTQWAIFMVAMGALVGVFVSMAVMKYRAEQLAIATSASQQPQMAMVAAPPAPPPPAALDLAMYPQQQVQPAQAVQPPQTIFTTTMVNPGATTTTTTKTSTSTPTPSTPTPTPSTPTPTPKAVVPVIKKAAPPPVAHHAGPKAPPVTTTTVRPSTAPKGDSSEQMLQAAKRETGLTLE